MSDGGISLHSPLAAIVLLCKSLDGATSNNCHGHKEHVDRRRQQQQHWIEWGQSERGGTSRNQRDRSSERVRPLAAPVVAAAFSSLLEFTDIGPDDRPTLPRSVNSTSGPALVNAVAGSPDVDVDMRTSQRLLIEDQFVLMRQSERKRPGAGVAPCDEATAFFSKGWQLSPGAENERNYNETTRRARDELSLVHRHVGTCGTPNGTRPSSTNVLSSGTKADCLSVAVDRLLNQLLERRRSEPASNGSKSTPLAADSRESAYSGTYSVDAVLTALNCLLLSVGTATSSSSTASPPTECLQCGDRFLATFPLGEHANDKDYSRDTSLFGKRHSVAASPLYGALTNINADMASYKSDIKDILALDPFEPIVDCPRPHLVPDSGSTGVHEVLEKTVTSVVDEHVDARAWNSIANSNNTTEELSLTNPKPSRDKVHVRHALLVLQGIPSTTFFWRQDKGCFTTSVAMLTGVDRLCCNETTQHLLNYFSQCGTTFRRLEDIAEQLQRMSNVPQESLLRMIAVELRSLAQDVRSAVLLFQDRHLATSSLLRIWSLAKQNFGKMAWACDFAENLLGRLNERVLVSTAAVRILTKMHESAGDSLAHEGSLALKAAPDPRLRNHLLANMARSCCRWPDICFDPHAFETALELLEVAQCAQTKSKLEELAQNLRAMAIGTFDRLEQCLCPAELVVDDGTMIEDVNISLISDFASSVDKRVDFADSEIVAMLWSHFGLFDAFDALGRVMLLQDCDWLQAMTQEVSDQFWQSTSAPSVFDVTKLPAHFLNTCLQSCLDRVPEASARHLRRFEFRATQTNTVTKPQIAWKVVFSQDSVLDVVFSEDVLHSYSLLFAHLLRFAVFKTFLNESRQRLGNKRDVRSYHRLMEHFVQNFQAFTSHHVHERLWTDFLHGVRDLSSLSAITIAHVSTLKLALNRCFLDIRQQQAADLMGQFFVIMQRFCNVAKNSSDPLASDEAKATRLLREGTEFKNHAQFVIGDVMAREGSSVSDERTTLALLLNFNSWFSSHR